MADLSETAIQQQEQVGNVVLNEDILAHPFSYVSDLGRHAISSGIESAKRHSIEVAAVLAGTLGLGGMSVLPGNALAKSRQPLKPSQILHGVSSYYEQTVTPGLPLPLIDFRRVRASAYTYVESGVCTQHDRSYGYMEDSKSTKYTDTTLSCGGIKKTQRWDRIPELSEQGINEMNLQPGLNSVGERDARSIGISDRASVSQLTGERNPHNNTIETTFYYNRDAHENGQQLHMLITKQHGKNITAKPVFYK
jgi:hypothetical protein